METPELRSMRIQSTVMYSWPDFYKDLAKDSQKGDF